MDTLEAQMTAAYGVYKVGNKVYESKIQAMIASHIGEKPVVYDFHDEYLDSFDWSEEPTETLAQLYLERAQQLRHDYDYLILHYSGGPDSHNVLETFLHNGLRIDEILIREKNLQDANRWDRSINNLAAESVFFAYPFARYIKDNHWPDLKITVIDMVPYIVDYFNKAKNWTPNMDTFFTDPQHIARFDWDFLHRDLLPLVESGKRVAHIIGGEKPRVLKDDLGYYLEIMDENIIRNARPRFQGKGMPYNMEMFYTHRNTAKLMMKQSHVLSRYMKQNGISNWKWDRSDEDKIASVIYDRKYANDQITVEKQPKTLPFMCPTMTWFTEDKNTDYFENWKHGMQVIKETIPDHFVVEDEFFSKGLRWFTAKKRYVLLADGE